MDQDDPQAEIEIFAKPARGDRCFEVLVGGRDDAGFEVLRLQPADPGKLALLEHAQQLGLQLQRQIADLVQEHRALAGGFELAGAPLGRAGEGAALVAEQFALDQAVRDSRAVDRDERLAPRAALKWIARATSSLPVPLSPLTRTTSILSLLTTRPMSL